MAPPSITLSSDKVSEITWGKSVKRQFFIAAMCSSVDEYPPSLPPLPPSPPLPPLAPLLPRTGLELSSGVVSMHTSSTSSSISSEEGAAV